MSNLIFTRLLNQQLAAPQFNSPMKIVSHMGAVQAQDIRMMRWAVGIRMQKPSLEKFKIDFNLGKILRLHLLRGTWQMIANEDYKWMHDLCAVSFIPVVESWMKSPYYNMSKEELNKVLNIIIALGEEKDSFTKEDLYAAIKEKLCYTATARSMYIYCIMAELNGIVVSGNLDKINSTYSLVSKKIKKQENISHEEALIKLARKYFQSHSPATLSDFVWWSGLKTSECKKAINSLKAEIVVEKWKDREFYILDTCRTRGLKKTSTLLLPSFDEYLIGYKTRDLVLKPEYSHYAHNKKGNFYPIIAHNGTICGNWKIEKKNIDTTLFVDHNVEVNLKDSVNKQIQEFLL